MARRFLQTKPELQELYRQRVLHHEACMYRIFDGDVPSSHWGLLEDPPDPTPCGERIEWQMLVRHEKRLLALVEWTTCLRDHYAEANGSRSVPHADVGNVWFGVDASPMSEGIAWFVDDLVGPASSSMVAEVRTDEAHAVACEYLLALLTAA